MVKGISRQVIVVDAPEPKLFEQAIFIIKDGSAPVTDEALMKEVNLLLRSAASGHKRKADRFAPLWAVGGAVFTGIVWLLTAIW